MTQKSTLLVAGLTSLLFAEPHGQASDVRARVETYVQGHQREIVSELVDLLSIPNHHSDSGNIRRNARLLREMLEKRGLEAELLETRGNPLVYGELKVPGAARTILIYIHYDGQATDPGQWKQASPFEPLLREGRLEDGARELPDFRSRMSFERHWRIYARSASDDKGPIVAFCAALDALRAQSLVPSSNLRVVFDGEEEGGFGSLVPAIATYRKKLRADLMLVFDGPVHASGRPTVVFGARGSTGVEITVYGPRSPLHSGHYGNWVPNPAMRLARLLASMKGDDGHVLIDGFYDGIRPLSAEERALLDAVPDDHESLMRLFGIAQPERKGMSLQEALQIPTLNIRGLSSGYVGSQARTIIPDRATALIDIRLVKETQAQTMNAKVRAHIRSQGYYIVEEDPTDAERSRYDRIAKVRGRRGTNAFRTSPLLPESKRVVRALTAMYGEPPVVIRTMGATLPVTPFIDALSFPAIIVPTVNFDNHQHAANENLKMGNFFDAIVTMAALLTM